MQERSFVTQRIRDDVIGLFEENTKNHMDRDSMLFTVEEVLKTVQTANLADVEVFMRKNQIAGYLVALPAQKDADLWLPNHTKGDRELAYALHVVFTYGELRTELDNLGVDYMQNLKRLRQTGLIRQD